MPTSAVRDAYVALAERIADALRRPRIRALHRPPPSSVAKDAEFCAIELDDASIGFSYVRLDGTHALLDGARDADPLAGLDALSVARGYASADPVRGAVGLAAINALSQSLFARAGWTPPPAGDSLADLAPAKGEHVGMIGLFPPLVERLVEADIRLTVLELRPELASEHAAYRVTLDPSALAGCDVVVSTCTVLLNDTLDAVLAACPRARRFAIVGPTAGAAPDPLFERGVAAVGGRRVVDAEGFRAAFRRGDAWGPFAAKYTIERGAYPGIDALLERARRHP